MSQGERFTLKIAAMLFLLLGMMALEAAGAEGSSDIPMQEVYAGEILEKIQMGQPVEYDHVIVRGDLDLSRERLQKNITSPIRINDSIFDSKINFNDAILEMSVDLSGSNFSKNAYFRRTIFSGYAIFREATFRSNAYIGWASFRGGAVFEEATFSGYADFKRATFSVFADFKEVTFNGYANFLGTTFSSYAFFRGASFSGGADFLGAISAGIPASRKPCSSRSLASRRWSSMEMLNSVTPDSRMRPPFTEHSSRGQPISRTAP